MEQTSTGRNTKNHEKLIMKLFNNLLLLILAIFIFILALALALTIQSKTDFATALKSITEGVGPLGDTLGGTMGPLVGIIASIFTYWAFMEQVEANRKQAEQFNTQFLEQQKDNFRNHFFEMLKLFLEKKKDAFNAETLVSFLGEVNFMYVAYNSLDDNFQFSNDQYRCYKHTRDETNDFINEFQSVLLGCKVAIFGLESIFPEILSEKEQRLVRKLLGLKASAFSHYNQPYDYEKSNLEPAYYAYCISNESGSNQKYIFKLKVKDEKTRIFRGNSGIIEMINNLKILLLFIYEANGLSNKEKEFYYSLLITQFTQLELLALYLIKLADYNDVFPDNVLIESRFFRHLNYRRIIDYVNPKSYFMQKFGDKIDINSFLEMSSILGDNQNSLT